jgi:hypothetical protein|tara:strand:- start:162 stop:491 length:330 start_codon:yes stop_codon:yes gene_type:complete
MKEGITARSKSPEGYAQKEIPRPTLKVNLVLNLSVDGTDPLTKDETVKVKRDDDLWLYPVTPKDHSDLFLLWHEILGYVLTPLTAIVLTGDLNVTHLVLGTTPVPVVRQ